MVHVQVIAHMVLLHFWMTKTKHGICFKGIIENCLICALVF